MEQAEPEAPPPPAQQEDTPVAPRLDDEAGGRLDLVPAWKGAGNLHEDVFKIRFPLADETRGDRPDLAASFAAAGISQPEGSKVIYDSFHSAIWVTNTAPNLERTRAYLERREKEKPQDPQR